MRNLQQIKDLKPNKLLGQNFLTDKSALKKIIEAAKLLSSDTVLEIGPGTGILTKELAQRVKKVIAVEKDQKMVEILRKELEEYNNVEIIQGDILKLISNFKLPISNYKVAANIPYYLTSNLIRNLLESKNPPEEIVLTIQKEVAERICSKPPDMSLLAVSVQFYAKAEIVGFISKKCFWPVPKVDSAIIKIRPLVYAPASPAGKDPKLIYANRKKINTDLFFKIVKAGFSQPRKQLLNNLKSLKLDKSSCASTSAKATADKKATEDKGKIKAWLLENKIKPSQRAETLEIKDWINLYKTFYPGGN